MKKNLIDTNLIIRVLTNDDPHKADQVEKLLKDKKSKNVLLDTVIAEIIWVLSSYYKLDKGLVIEKIQSLISIDSVICNHKIISKSLILWKSNQISYIDAYIASVAQVQEINIYSYDQKFDTIKNIKRLEP